MREIQLGPNDARQSIEKFMGKFFKTMPNGLVHKFLRKKCVRVNGKHVKAGAMLQEGDCICFYIPDEFFPSAPVYQMDFSRAKDLSGILYEDADILLIVKPAGIRMHDDKQHKTDTLLAQVKKYLWEKGEYDPQKEWVFSPAFCNRIDTNTSGIVIAAKNAEALRFINDQIQKGGVKKQYLCVCEGVFEKKEALLTGYFTKDAEKNRATITTHERPGSKIVQTQYKVLQEKDNCSLVQVLLLTGRSHQIRAHLSLVGHPICGDGKYGHQSPLFSHQALVAYRLTFDFINADARWDAINSKTFQLPKVEFAGGFVVERRETNGD